MTGQTKETPVYFPVPADRLWLDPRWIAFNLYVQETDIKIGGGQNTPLLTPNYDRWAVGFASVGGTGTGATVSPFVPAQSGDGITLPDHSLLWYDQKTYGPLIGSAWYATGILGNVIRCIEVIRRNGG